MDCGQGHGAYGFACRQVHGPDWDDPVRHFVLNFDFGLMSEDCLSLNVWTQGLGGSRKRPIMVWIHGGGFQNGSSFELPCYDGENLCRRGEVVLVSLIGRDQLGRLQALPYDELMAAARKANEAVARDRPRRAGEPTLPAIAWRPTADGTIMAGAPLIQGGPRFDAGIPLLVGCTLNEISPSAYDEPLESITRAAVVELVAKTYEGRAAALVAAYEKQYPGAKPIDVLSMVESLRMGGGSLTQAGEKADQGNAAVYAYRFDWNPEVCDGRLRAFHALDMTFSFDNTDRWESATGGGARARALGAIISQAWVNFARTGDPNHQDLPAWPRYDRRNGAMMIFDDRCRGTNHPDAEIRKLVYES